MALDTIKNKLSEAISIKSDMLSAFSTRGLSVTSSTPFSAFPSLIMSVHDNAQANKDAFPRAEGLIVRPDSGYDAMVQVTVASEPELLSQNIAMGHSIYGVVGTAAVQDDVANMIEGRCSQVVDLSGVITSFPAVLNQNNEPLWYEKIVLPGVSTLVSSHFSWCSRLEEVSLPLVTEIPDYAFYYCCRMKSVTFGALTKVGNYAFQSCSMFDPTPYLSTLTSIGTGAFYGTLLSVMLSSHSSVVPSGMYANTQLTEIPESYYSTLTSVGSGAFSGCRLMGTLSLPACSIISSYAFSGTLISALYLSSVTRIGSYAFGTCTNLRTVSIEAPIQEIGSYAFSMCGGLSYVYMKCLSTANATIGSGTFYNCSRLKSMKLEGPWSFPALQVFYQAYQFSTLVLTNSAVIPLGNSTAFTYTAIGNRGSSAAIFVPASLVSNYKTAQQWSYFSSLFRAIPDGGIL